MTKSDKWIIEEMKICREYCSLILKERTRVGFNSLKYPVITATLDRYFLPEFRQLIADECNLIGYMDIEPVEYEPSNIKVKLDIIRTTWQDQLFNERVQKREEAENRKLLVV